MTVQQPINPADRFDWKNPDYPAVFTRRSHVLANIRRVEAKWQLGPPRKASEPGPLDRLKAFYRENPWQFITDWGCTVDPRNPEIGLPAVVPFILFPRQIEWCEWIIQRWRAREPGVTFKSRELGVTWLAVALSATLCLFNRSLTIGFGSRKLELVDKLGDPDSIFWKAREFLELVPPEFKGGWTRKDAPEKVIKFPSTGSTMKGEGGDEIGRGGRASIYFIDESSKLEHPILVDAALSQTTNCRQDIGTANGIGNPFWQKVNGLYKPEWVFLFNWRDDPRKGQDWYDALDDRMDPVTKAQEVDMDFAASVTGVVIPAAWVQSMVDAHVKLGIEPTGARGGSLDVADEGVDNNAFIVSHGCLLEFADEWTGAGSDIFKTTQRAFGYCEMFQLDSFDYDADGLGAGVRGDARVINEQRAASGQRQIDVQPFRGSGEIINPEGEDVPKRKNKDFFKNQKAQSWWGLRMRAQATHRAVNGEPYDPADIISISSKIPAQTRTKLVAELSQVTYEINNTGHIVIIKTPDGTRSPNLGDGVMMRFGRRRRAMRVSAEALKGI